MTERSIAPPKLNSLDPVDRAFDTVAAQTRHFVARHPRKIAAAISLALAGFGATAFGLAPLMPDPADLPRRMITEEVVQHGVASQLEALADHRREVPDQKDHGVPQILELPHLVQDDGVPDVNVRRSRIQTELDAQWHTGCF